MQYLSERQVYEDRYDLFTIKECIDVIKMFQKVYDESLTAEKMKEVPKREKYRTVNQLMYFQLCFTQAERYKRRQETIQKWMDEDRTKQEKQDNTPVPLGIYCPDCKTHMKCTSRILEDYTNEPIRVLFFFDCPSCKKRSAIYDNGEEHISKPQLCPKCNAEVKVSIKRKGKILTWKTACSSCKYTETSVDDFDKMDAERGKRQAEEKDLLAKYRGIFCVSEEVGKKFLFNMEALQYSHEAYQEERQKYDNTAYMQTTQVTKLSIVELEKKLTELLEKGKYIKLSFTTPEMGQFVIVPFTVQDADSSRRENVSIATLQKLIKDLLKDTNWRLVDGISYRLGYLSARLKGYEREEDIMELYGKKKEQKLTEQDDQKHMKYNSSTWVKWARMSGEHDGIEAARKKRLEKEPEGFFLDPDKGGYTCAICGSSFYGNDMWWNLDGIRCRDCWRNIKEGVIPSLGHKNEDIWMKKFDLEYHYDIKPPTIRKLVKEGLLHGRDLKRVDGSTYCTVYLVSENQELLKRYPKKEARQGQMLVFDIDGHLAGLPEPEIEPNASEKSQQAPTS